PIPGRGEPPASGRAPRARCSRRDRGAIAPHTMRTARRGRCARGSPQSGTPDKPTAGRESPLHLPRHGQPAELPHAPDGLADDLLRHLRLALAPVDEDDRDLADAEAPAPCPHADLDLERVSIGLDAIQLDRLEDFPAERLE